MDAMSVESVSAKSEAKPEPRATVLKRSLADFQERELRYRELLDAPPSAIYTTDAAGRITFYNEACVAFSGRRPEIGTDAWCVTWKLYQPDGAPLPHDQCSMAVALKENRPVRGGEAVAERPDGTRVPFIAYPTPLRDSSGALIGAVNMLVDITQRKEAEERLKLLSYEVNHRANNLLAVVQATLRLTQAETVEAFKKTLEGRIHALGRAHSLVAQSRWEGADLHRLVTEELAPYVGAESPQVWASGPSLPLSPSSAQSMALAIHELATNAAKYGALSVRSGSVHVHWGRDGDGSLRFRWTESGGPPVTPPTRSGVGTLVIERAVGQLDGYVKLDWLPQGLTCEIVSHHYDAASPGL
jgi:PAS domain S-box-containing protein